MAKKVERLDRVKYLDVSAEILGDILKEASKNALPKDAQMMRFRYEINTHCWRLIIHSKEFDRVPEGAEIPRHDTPVISSDRSR